MSQNRPGLSNRPVQRPSNANRPSAAQQYQTWMQLESNVKQKTAWEGTQEKAFSRWTNFVLAKRDLEIQSLLTDLADGKNLCALLEILSGKKIKINPKPTMRIQKLENVTVCLDFIKNEGIKLMSISANNIVDGDKKLIFGLIWTLIEHFQIKMDRKETKSPKNDLLEWVRTKIPEYNIKDFTQSWVDGKPICALAEAICPGQLDIPECFTGDATLDAFLGINAAKDNMGIPIIVDAADMVNSPDELAMMTYISYFRDYDNDPSKKKKIDNAPAPTIDLQISPPRDSPVNVPINFTIRGENVQPNQIKVAVREPNGRTITPTINTKPQGGNRNNFDVSFTPTSPGEHSIQVLLNDKLNKDCTCKVNVVSAPTISLGLNPPSNADVNVPIDFSLNGENVNPNQLKVVVRAPNGRTITPSIVTKPSGGNRNNFAVSFTPNTPGEHKIDVLLDDKPVKDCSCSVHVNAPSSLHLNVSPPRSVPINVPVDFSLSGDNVKPNQVKVVVRAPNGRSITPSITTKPLGSGNKFDISFTPVTEGEHKIDVLLDDKPLKDCSSVVNVESPASLSYLNANAPKSGVVNVPVEFSLVGDNTKPSQVKVAVRTPNGRTITPSITTKPQGGNRNKFEVSFTPTSAGEHKIDVLLDDRPVKDLACSVQIEDPIELPNAYVDEEYTIPFATSNKTAPSACQSTLTDPQGKSTRNAVSLNNGNGAITFTPKVRGRHQCSLNVNGEPLNSNYPCEVVVLPKITFLGARKNDGPRCIGQPAYLQTIKLHGLVPSEIEVNVTDPTGKIIKGECVPTGEDNVYDVQFTPLNEGRHQMQMQYRNGRDIHGGSPINLDITSKDLRGTVNRPETETPVNKVFNFHCNGGAQHQPSAFSLNLYSFKQNRNIPVQQFKAYQRGSDIHFDFVPVQTGVHRVETLVNGKEVKGSSFLLLVTHDIKLNSQSIFAQLDTPQAVYKLQCIEPGVTKNRIQFTCKDESGRNVVTSVEPAGRDVFNLLFTAQRGGRHTFQITIDNEACCDIPEEGLFLDFPDVSKSSSSRDSSTPSKSSSSKTTSSSNTNNSSSTKSQNTEYVSGVWAGQPHTLNVNMPSTVNVNNLVAEVVSPSGRKTSHKVQKDPTRLVFTPNDVGTYKITFMYEGRALGSTSVTAQDPDSV